LGFASERLDHHHDVVIAIFVEITGFFPFKRYWPEPATREANRPLDFVRYLFYQGACAAAVMCRSCNTIKID